MNRRRCLIVSITMAPLAAPAAHPEKLCALTFDDGPHPVQTAQVLDKLQALGVPATFFVIGRQINDATRPVVQRLLAAGHELGHHSWSHPHLTGLSRDQVRAEYERGLAAITQAGGRAPRFFRAPFLDADELVFDTVPLPFVGGIAAFDWPGTDAVTARQRADKILGSPALRDGAILVLHDVQPEPHPTAETLDLLVPELRRRGYRFVTLSQLFERKQIRPAAGARRHWQVVE